MALPAALRAWEGEGMTARARLLGLLAALVLPLAAAAQEAPATEPRTGAPAVFFLNARNTGRDFVYLSVGGSPHRPPTNLDQVVLGWSWNEAGTEIPSYPSGVRLGSLPFDRLGEEKDARFWRTSATEASFPPLGIGPGQGLWLLDGEHRAQTWAALLDAVEAAYRQTLIEPPPASDGLATIGHLGSCPVHSLPMPGSDDTWRFLHLPGSARPSLTGGQYFVDPRQATGKTESITTQRYLRWVVNPSNCLQNSNLALRLFPIPGRGSAYFLEFTEVTVRRVGFFALDPEGFHPGVVRLAPTQGPERTVLDLPPAAADLCTYPDLGTMCQRDASRRRQIFTIAPEYGEMLHGQTLTVACQGSLSAASCSDASVWGKKRGPFLMEYQGTLRLHEDPLLTSHLIDGRPVWRLEGSESQAAAGGVLQLRLPGRDSLTLELVPPPPPSSRPDAEGQTTPPSPSSALDPRAWVIATWPWWSVAAGFVVLVLLIGARRRRSALSVPATTLPSQPQDAIPRSASPRRSAPRGDPEGACSSPSDGTSRVGGVGTAGYHHSDLRPSAAPPPDLGQPTAEP